MRKAMTVLLAVALIPLFSGSALAKKAYVKPEVDTTPKIATEPYPGGSSGSEPLTVQEAQKRLEQGSKKTSPYDSKSTPPPVPEESAPPDQSANWNAMKRVYYGAGIMGGGFAKDAKLGCTGYTGAYSFLEFRFTKVISLSTDVYGGWLFGNGSFYYSGPNLGVRIYPMAYSNPKFEFMIEAGGHPLEIVTSNSKVNGTAMGQGGYGGLGFIIRPEGSMFGVMIGARASILWMQGPADDGTTNKKRRLAVPILGMTSIIF